MGPSAVSNIMFVMAMALTPGWEGELKFPLEVQYVFDNLASLFVMVILRGNVVFYAEY